MSQQEKEHELSEWITTADAAWKLGVSRRRVLQLITDEKVLEAKKLNPRLWLINRRSLEEYKASL